VTAGDDAGSRRAGRRRPAGSPTNGERPGAFPRPSTGGERGAGFPSDVAERCDRCGRSLDRRAAYELRGAGGPARCCRRCALQHRPLLRRSLLIALVVGSVLTAINHGDALLAGPWPAALLWKIPVTFLVPFVVASWGALPNGRAR